MSFIDFTKLSNGIMFDLSAKTGSEVSSAKFVFRPSSFHTIVQVSVQDNKMWYTTTEDKDFNFSFDGANGITQLKISGVTATDNYDLFTKFTALL